MAKYPKNARRGGSPTSRAGIAAVMGQKGA
jgi:hypothetical protein